MGHSLSPLSVLPSARERLLQELSEELDALEAAGLRRRLTTIESVDGSRLRLGGRSVVCWCSNDYLGLSTHPALREAASRSAAEWGVGAQASRLLAGTSRWHARLEEALAAWFGAGAAIVFPSGYHANLGTLGSLLAPDDAVFVDRLAHASLVDAARATRATLRVFHHNDIEQLSRLLAQATRARRRFIVTEGLFSMDGDVAPLAELVAVAETHEAMVYLDDAHGAFVSGATGRGSPEAAGVALERILYMGTLGKALGCQGGFVVGPRPLIDYLVNRSRTFIYTTALAIPVTAAAVEALQLLQQEPERMARLRDQVKRLRARCAQLPNVSASSPSQIVPIVVGETRAALDLAQHLWERGHWTPAIRPPTVPEGTARLRVSITALHTEEEIDQLADALVALWPKR